MKTSRVLFLASALFAASSFTASAQCVPGQVDTSYGANNNGFTQISPVLRNAITFEGHAVGGPGEGTTYMPVNTAMDSSNEGIPSIIAVKKNGNRDLTFGGFGSIVPQPVGPVFDATNAIDPSGSHVVGLLTSAGVTITRYTPSGALDTTFGGGTGFASVPLIGGAFGPWQIAAANDGSVYVAIASVPTVGGQREPVVIKLTPAGALDPTFGTGGFSYFLPGQGSSSRASSVIPLPSGTVLVGGRAGDNSTHTRFFIARLLPNGSLDPTFGVAGVSIVDFGPVIAFGRRLALDSRDDAIVLSGPIALPSDPGTIIEAGIARFRPDGTLDTRFNGTGTLVIPGTGSGFNVAVENNGSIITAGQQTVGATSTAALVRITRTGAIDTSFGAAGTALIPVPGYANSNASDVFVNGGKIVVKLLASDAALTTFADFAAGVCR